MRGGGRGWGVCLVTSGNSQQNVYLAPEGEDKQVLCSIIFTLQPFQPQNSLNY